MLLCVNLYRCQSIQKIAATVHCGPMQLPCTQGIEEIKKLRTGVEKYIAEQSFPGSDFEDCLSTTLEPRSQLKICMTILNFPLLLPQIRGNLQL